MTQIRTQPAGPKAFHLYATVRDTYRQELGERTFAVYQALTYYVDPKTLQGAIPLKLLAQTIQSHPTTISRHLRAVREGNTDACGSEHWKACGSKRSSRVTWSMIPPGGVFITLINTFAK